MTISICLCTYNGIDYIGSQLESILNQEVMPTEIVVVDDASVDGTADYVEKILSNSKIRYKISRHSSNRGVNVSFTEASKLASCDIICFSDQDDFWFPNRIKVILKAFEADRKLDLVLVDSYIVSLGTLMEERTSEHYGYTQSFLLNLFKNHFTGCHMAIKKNLTDCLEFLPTNDLFYYDHFLSMVALLRGSTFFESTALGHYHRHGKNLTDLNKRGSFFRVISGRLQLVFSVIKFLVSSLKRRKLA